MPVQPPPGFVLDTPLPPLGGRPIIRKGPEPVKPDLPQGYQINNGTAAPVPGLPSEVTQPEAYRPITKEERQQYGVDPQKPFVVNLKTGKPEFISQGAGQDASTPAADPDRAFQNDSVLKGIAGIRKLALKPLSHGTGTDYLKYIPIVGQNAANLDAALMQVKGDILRNVLAQAKQASPNGASGFGNLSNVEGEALKASIAHLSQAQTTDQFTAGLDQAEQYYKRALARSQGLDPMDPAVAHRLGITLPQGTSAAPQDNGITKSAPPPLIGGVDPTAVSAEQKTIIDPFLQKFGPRLEQMLAADPKKISNGMIIGFIQKNGGNASTMSGLNESLQFRTSKERQRARWYPHVDPRISVPLSEQGVGGSAFLSEKDRASAVASPVGAGFVGAADTGTMGAMPDIIALASAIGGGDYGGARSAFKDKQEMIAANQPGGTAIGNFLGALPTMAIAAPETYLGLVGQAAGQGAAYGGLSSDDPSFEGRFGNAAMGGVVNAAAAATMDPALRLAGAGVRKGAVNPVKRLLGLDPEDIANSNALSSFAGHAPQQDVPAMRVRATEQAGLGAEPTGLTTLDRSGQDYLGRQVARSPGARQAADEAVSAAQERLPAHLEQDFTQAIDDAVGPDKNVAAYLKRPAREITADIQGMAGREYEAGIAPIANERLTIDNDLAESLGHERIRGAISDALSSHSLSDETRQVLRHLPRELQSLGSGEAPANLGANASAQIAAAQQQVRDQALKNIPLTVDAARNLATALDRTASRLADGSEGGVELRRLSRSIRDKIGEQYPEFQPVNARYASRMRAIGALDDARNAFLGDTTGEKTDALAKATSRMSAAPGEPEFGASPTETGGFQVSRKPQSLPSEKQMAIAGAREATVAKAANGSEAGVAERLSSVGQKERNRMILGDRAKALEARASAKAANVRTTERLQSGGQSDDAGGKVSAGMKAAANLGFHRGGAAIASALSGIRGLGQKDAARVVKLYTDPNKAEFVIRELEKAYGRRKARFIIDRIGALTVTANKTRQLPAEATQ